MNLRHLPTIVIFVGVVIGFAPQARLFAEEPAAKNAAFTEPKPGTPERKAIMDAMRIPVSKHVGKAVTFTGDVRVSGNWARFQGNVAPTDGKTPKDENVAAELDLDFFALLKKDAEGVWRVKHWGFAGDIGVSETARERFPEAPKALFE